MKRTAISIALLGVFFTPQFSQASVSHFTQTVKKQLPLPEVFKKLSKATNTQFFYSVSDLKNIEIDDSHINYNSLDETLAYLSKNYPIVFSSKINNTISVKRIGSKENAFALETKQIDQVKQVKRDSISPKQKEIEEVVLIGYGSRKKTDVTGSVVSMKASDMKDFATTSITDAMVGKVTGVQIVNSQAQPGSGSNIKMRGTATITAGSDPLIVVDGFPLTEGSNINSIDPNSIESMDFLKDAASTAIYGSRGANGVIIIKTKEGRKGKIDISINSVTSFQERADNVKLVNAYEFAQYELEARNNGYISKDPIKRNITDSNDMRKQNGASKRELIPSFLLPYLSGRKGLTDTDWLGEVFRTAPMQNHSINISGGSDKMQYSVTGSYLKQDGIIIGSDYEKISSSVNINSKLSDRFKIGVSFTPSYSNINKIDPNSGWNYNPFNIALISYPFFSTHNPDGSAAISEQYKANLDTDGALVENPLAIVKYVKNKENIFRIFGNSFVEFKIFSPLTYKLSLGGDYQSYTRNFFDPSTVGKYRTGAPDKTIAERNTTNKKNYLIENLLTFNKKINDHNIEILAGQSYQQENYEGTMITATGFPDNSLESIAGGTEFKVNPSEYSWSLISYFSRANYSYASKYLLSASYRKDGSSRFGKNTKWASFPAFSAGWVVSKENFFPDNPFINNLKLRASWGKSGNNQIDNFGAKALLQISNYNYDGTLAPGYITNTAPNPNLTWESTSSTNFGIDLALFNNRIGINADYYTTYNKGLLLNVPVPFQSGYQTSLQNIGELKNKGLEIQISTIKPVQLGEIKWTTSLNLSSNKNTILALAPGQKEIIAGAGGYSINRVGGSISELYGYEVTGVYKTQAEIDATPHMKGTLVGDYIISDLNGDKIIDNNDKKSWGTVTPKLIGGFNNTLSYRGLSLSFNLYGELGKQIYSRTLASLLEAGEGFSMIAKEYYDNRFHPINNPNGTYAMPNLGNFSNDRKEARYSNKFFKDASYIRLRSVKLSYDIPKDFTQRVGVNHIQLFVMANNLATWTKYNGFNVDSNSNNPLALGYDDANYPTARVYSFGLNLNF